MCGCGLKMERRCAAPSGLSRCAVTTIVKGRRRQAWLAERPWTRTQTLRTDRLLRKSVRRSQSFAPAPPFGLIICHALREVCAEFAKFCPLRCPGCAPRRAAKVTWSQSYASAMLFSMGLQSYFILSTRWQESPRSAPFRLTRTSGCHKAFKQQASGTRPWRPFS